MKEQLGLKMGLVICLSVVLFACAKSPPESFSLSSPSGIIQLDFSTKTVADGSKVPYYQVKFGEKMVVEEAGLGLGFQQSGKLKQNLQITNISSNSHDETYEVFAGKSLNARNHHNEIRISFEETTAPNRRLNMVFRAFDDGLTFRYEIPEQESLRDFIITDELTTFCFPGDPLAFQLPLNSYKTHYERTYRVLNLGAFEPDSLTGLPLLLELDNDLWIAITEANLTDYAGMYLKPVPGKPNFLISALSPWPDNPEIKVKGSAPHRSPWRVLMIANHPGRLIESNIILHLNEPNAIGDTDWIQTGKMNWPWWCNHQVEDVDFESGMNTETMKYYIDFFAAHGIDFHGIVQHGRKTWFAPMPPNNWRGFLEEKHWNDPTVPVPELDMQEVLSYAEAKDMRIRLHLHWAVLQGRLDKVFQAYEDWGIHGIMWDFMNRDDQKMVNLYHQVMQTAAKHHLTIIAHGAYKPTGIRRTYPNLLTREGVLNLEYVKWSDRCHPEHNLIVPFTRMLAGPLDYHLGGFRNVTREQFKPNFGRPVVMGTRCHNMAMYIVYESPLQKLCDSPEAYQDQAGFEFLKQVPTTWDETRVIDGHPADFITIARRKGEDWYVGSMTDWSARTLLIPLSFLPQGVYQADIWADGPDVSNDPTDILKEQKNVTSEDTITAELVSGGGHILVLRMSDKTE